jgi:hypothetical protein
VKKRKIIPVAIALVAVIAVSGVAYAFWTSSGTGSGTGSVANGVSGLVVHQVAPALTAMYPGDVEQTTHVTIENGTTQSVHVTTVSLTSVTTLIAGCTDADFSRGVAVTPWGAGGTDIAAGATTTPAVAGPTIQFFNDPGRSQDACKGAAVTLHFSAS